jgi:hypothetical protein
MKIEIKKEVSEMIEVELPFYRKSKCNYYIVYSDRRCICVCNLEENESIMNVTVQCAFLKTTDCTKKEFDLEYERISNILNDLRK